ncbi:MAG: hypothetical protein WC812_02745 [Candidatus Pacearchaeota archaeon]|jgi:hypothetical protein
MKKNTRAIRYNLKNSANSDDLKTEWTFFIVNDADYIPEIIKNIKYYFEESGINKIDGMNDLIRNKFNGNGLEYLLLKFKSDRNALLSKQERDKIWLSPGRFKKDCEMNIEGIYDLKSWADEYLNKIFAESDDEETVK